MNIGFHYLSRVVLIRFARTFCWRGFKANSLTPMAFASSGEIMLLYPVQRIIDIWIKNLIYNLSGYPRASVFNRQADKLASLYPWNMAKI